jgi:hypothetical protein
MQNDFRPLQSAGGLFLVKEKGGMVEEKEGRGWRGRELTSIHFLSKWATLSAKSSGTATTGRIKVASVLAIPTSPLLALNGKISFMINAIVPCH